MGDTKTRQFSSEPGIIVQGMDKPLQFFPVRYQFARVARIVLVAIALFGTWQWIGHSLVSRVLLLFLGFPIGLAVSGFFTKAERNRVRSILGIQYPGFVMIDKKVCLVTLGHQALDDRIFYKEALSLSTVYRQVMVLAVGSGPVHEVERIRILQIEPGRHHRKRW